MRREDIVGAAVEETPKRSAAQRRTVPESTRTTYTDGYGRQTTTGGYFALPDGRAVTARLKQDLQRLSVELSFMATADGYPPDHRSRVRAEKTQEARELREEARAAIAGWSAKADGDARKRLAGRPLGDAAEESRRVANELRIGRMVDRLRRNDTPRADAQQLAERADAAYARGDLDEAEVLATAARELAPTRLAEEVVALVNYDRIAADPDKLKASRDLDDIAVVNAAFDRDGNAAFASAMRDSLALATSLGQVDPAAQREMTSASITAKMAAAIGAIQHGDGTYVEPEGVTPGLVQNISRPGHVPQPPGARLGGKTVPDR
jgi:hypothetical protein